MKVYIFYKQAQTIMPLNIIYNYLAYRDIIQAVTDIYLT